MKRIVIFALIFAMLLSFTLTAYASEIDPEKTGSIHVTMKHNGAPVAGGSLTIYRVADLKDVEGEYKLVFTETFQNCGLPLENLKSETSAASFAEYIKDKSVTGVKKNVDSQGKIAFTELSLGLYLVIQEDAAKGYFPAAPFLITVPVEGENAWVYDVDASPKIALAKEPQPGQPGKPNKPNIPQTGQLNWPIPVLVISGMCLFALGWALCFVLKKKQNET